MYGKRGIIAINAALLAESNMLYLCNNNIILVTADRNIQRDRLRQKQLTDKQIERRLHSQYSAEQKKERIEQKIREQHHGALWRVDSSATVHQGLFEEVAKGITYLPAQMN
jgi:hypothetical protein